jgi:hypothetical protein
MSKSTKAPAVPVQAEAPLKFHPLAELFPLMEGKEFAELVDDIKNGLNEPITLFQGMVLDGRNRARACAAAGVKPRYHQFSGNEADARAYVISMNIRRRHLSANQRRSLLMKVVKAQPEKSDRAIADKVGVDHKQVSRARRKAESTGAIAPVKKRTGVDGKKRRQPAKKRAKTPTTSSPPTVPRAAAPPAVAPPEPATPSECSKTKDLEQQIAADRKYARDLVKQDRSAAQWLRAILGNERRRSAVADALVGALTESATPSSATGGNDTDAAESAEARKVVFATADREVAQ